tara:strand:+ start:432 stop:1016 length:585 start_codon:yes stop_codon:yes gene_type:complete
MSFWHGKAQTPAQQHQLKAVLKHVMPVHVSQSLCEQQTHPSLPRMQHPEKQLQQRAPKEHVVATEGMQALYPQQYANTGVTSPSAKTSLPSLPLFGAPPVLVTCSIWSSAIGSPVLSSASWSASSTAWYLHLPHFCVLVLVTAGASLGFKCNTCNGGNFIVGCVLFSALLCVCASGDYHARSVHGTRVRFHKIF